jgi:aspartyl protease family protein
MAVGRVFVDVEVSNPKKPLRASVRALVDTGVTYTVLPEELFRKLELEGLVFVKVKTGVGVEDLLETEIPVKVLGGERASPALVNGEVDTPLIGVMTPEILGLKIDPTTGRIEELPLLLYSVAAQKL